MGPRRQSNRPGTISTAAHVRVSACAATLLLASLVSCGGGDGAAPQPTAPTTEVTVVVVVASVSPPTVEGTVSCVVELTADVKGTGIGTWAGATYRMFDAAEKTRALAEGDVTGAVLLDGFGTGSVIPGRSQYSKWRFTGPTAFAAELQMRYEPAIGAPLKTSTVKFDCVPPFSVGGAAPTVRTLVVTPSQKALDAGAPITVQYSAALPSGALRTGVRITGPCVVDRVFDERADTTVSRTLTIPLPYPCRLGAAIGVSVVAVDVLGRGTALYQATPVIIQDTVPPQAYLQLLHLIPGSTTVPTYAEYALTDTLLAQMGMSDNYRVSAILWELLPVGLKDSIVSPESPSADEVANGGEPVRIGIRPEWAGKSLQLRLQARDAAGRLSQVVTTPLDSIRVAPAPSTP